MGAQKECNCEGGKGGVLGFCLFVVFCCFLWGEAGGGGGGGKRGHGDFETPLPTIFLNQFYEPTIIIKIKGKYIFKKRKRKETLTCLDGCNGEHDFSSAINVCVQYTQDVLKLLRNYETLEQNTYTKISETRP